MVALSPWYTSRMSESLQNAELLKLKLIEALDGIGVYVAGEGMMNIQTIPGLLDPDESGNVPDVDKVLIDGRGTMTISLNARVNEVAFTQRVLDPEGFATDTQIEMNSPSEAEIMSKTIDEDVSGGWDDDW